MKNIRIFYPIFFLFFLVVKFSIYLKRHVFVMRLCLTMLAELQTVVDGGSDGAFCNSAIFIIS